MRMIIQTIIDGGAVVVGCLLAAWLRFGSGLIPLFHDSLSPHDLYVTGAILAAGIIVLSLHATQSYGARRFTKPVAGLSLGLLLVLAGALFFRAEPPFSRIVLLFAAILIPAFLLGERALIGRINHRVE